MDREVLAHVLREWPEEVAAQGESGDHAGPLMTFFTAVPGSGSEEKPRLLAAADD